MEKSYDYTKEINYVVERAIAEGSVPRYLEQKSDSKLDMKKLVSDVILLEEQFMTKVEEGEEFGTTDDEHNYIAEVTGYPIETIELVLWFHECYRMADDCITLVGNCQKCDGDVLYFREDDDVLYGCFIECGQCGEKYTLEQMFEYESD